MLGSSFHLVVGFAPSAPSEELRALLAAGVSEIFVGYVPRSWLARYGAETSPNRRHFVDRQFLDRDVLSLADAIAETDAVTQSARRSSSTRWKTRSRCARLSLLPRGGRHHATDEPRPGPAVPRVSHATHVTPPWDSSSG